MTMTQNLPNLPTAVPHEVLHRPDYTARWMAGTALLGTLSLLGYCIGRIG